MPYDTDNRSGITKNASESQRKGKVFQLFPFFVQGGVARQRLCRGCITKINRLLLLLSQTCINFAE